MNVKRCIRRFLWGHKPILDCASGGHLVAVGGGGGGHVPPVPQAGYATVRTRYVNSTIHFQINF